MDLFEGLTDEQLDAWAAVTEIQDAADGRLMLEQGGSPGPLLLFEGHTKGYIEQDGRIDPMTPNHAPTWIGAIAAITESAVPLNVEADGPCRFAIVPRDDFIRLAMTQPSVHQKVMHVIGPVMRGINSREASRERLTSLGTMAAGLAHELNNPAAAARRAASDLVDAVDVINHALEAFVESGIEREDAAKLLDLQREAIERARRPRGDGRDRRVRRRGRDARRARGPRDRGRAGSSPSRSAPRAWTPTGSSACRRSPAPRRARRSTWVAASLAAKGWRPSCWSPPSA